VFEGIFVSKIDVQIIDDLNVRIVHVNEAVSFADIVHFFEHELEPRIVLNTIWDLQPGALQHLNLEELKRFVAMRRTNIERRRGGNTVLVASEMSERMLIKWYKTFAEVLDFHDVKFHVADSLEEAIAIVRATCVSKTQPLVSDGLG